MSAEDAWKFELLAGRPEMEPREADDSDGDGRELVALMERSGGRCCYCGSHMTYGGAGFGTSITREHVLPLSRGGSNDPTNIVGACRACNVSKQGKTVEEFRAYCGGAVFYGEQRP